MKAGSKGSTTPPSSPAKRQRPLRRIEACIRMSPTNTYIVPLAMLAVALMVIAAALWL
jgi:hypothetical protein